MKIYWVGNSQDYVALYDGGNIKYLPAGNPSLPIQDYLYNGREVQVHNPDTAVTTIGSAPYVASVTGSGAVLTDGSDSTYVTFVNGTPGSGGTAVRMNFTYNVNGFWNQTPSPLDYYGEFPAQFVGARVRASCDFRANFWSTDLVLHLANHDFSGEYGDFGMRFPYSGFDRLAAATQWWDLTPDYFPFFGAVSQLGPLLQYGQIDCILSAYVGVTVYEIELTWVVDVPPVLTGSQLGPVDSFGVPVKMQDGSLIMPIDGPGSYSPWGLRLPADLDASGAELIGGPGNGATPFYPDFQSVIGLYGPTTTGGVYDSGTNLTWFRLDHTQQNGQAVGDLLDYDAIWAYVEADRSTHSPGDLFSQAIWAGVDADGIIQQRLGYLYPDGNQYFYGDNEWDNNPHGYVGNPWIIGRYLYCNYNYYGDSRQCGLARWNIDTNVPEYVFDDTHNRMFVGYDSGLGVAVSANQDTGEVETFLDLDSLPWTTADSITPAPMSSTSTFPVPDYDGGGRYVYWYVGWGQIAVPGDGFAYYFVEKEYGVDWDDTYDPDTSTYISTGDSLQLMRLDLTSGDVEALFDVPYVWLDIDGNALPTEDGAVTYVASMPFGLLVLPDELFIDGQLEGTRVRLL